MGVGGVFHQGRPDARFRRPLPPTPRVPLPPASSPAAGPGPLYAPLIPETRVPLWLREILFPILNLFQTIGDSSSNLFSRQMIWNIRKTGVDPPRRPSAWTSVSPCAGPALPLGRIDNAAAAGHSSPPVLECSPSHSRSVPSCPIAFIPSNFFFVMSTPSLNSIFQIPSVH